MIENDLKLSECCLEALQLKRGQQLILSGIDIGLKSGEALSITGANGSGKTSLLRAIAGLLPLDSGQIRFFNDQILLDSDLIRTQAVHFLSHQDGLKSSHKVLEEITFWAKWFGSSVYPAKAIETLELEHLLDLEIRQLSAGQRRRVFLTRFLAAPRTLWLLDEPMAPLDARMRLIFAGMMQTHLSKGGMIFAATHDPLPFPTQTLGL